MYNDVMPKKLDQKRGIARYDLISKNYETSSIHNMTSYPIDNSATINVNARTGSLSGESEYYMLAGMFSPIIEIISLDDYSVREIRKPKDEMSFLDRFDSEKLMNDEYPEAYIHSDSFKDKFYLLYSGSLYGENRDKIIEIIDFEGETLEYLRIPKKYEITKILLLDETKIVGLSQSKDEIYFFNQ